ncbi:glucosidase II beta subunit, putative [Bodo saltans]|uniref:Glucosidase II beta subunit, putative n=1 Tax=Bodo saltans TaxID=75058 RepID=A0A0S4JHT1_BODSA|nr:glucosidase II beta subunit, putative [Bodo saltans]|eukprot:CUG89841.1 glucosidase II beta subunit, putative [Bodo saltans]
MAKAAKVQPQPRQASSANKRATTSSSLRKNALTLVVVLAVVAYPFVEDVSRWLKTTDDSAATTTPDTVVVSSSRSSSQTTTTAPSNTIVLAAGSTFRCGDRVIGWEVVADDNGQQATQKKLLRVAPAKGEALSSDHAAATVVPIEYVDDNYCDCADGSDEPFSAGCSSGGQLVAYQSVTTLSAARDEHSFHCPLTASVLRGSSPWSTHNILSPSRMNDGVLDCCNLADEKNSYHTGPTATIDNTCAKVKATFNERLQRLRQRYLGSGHKEFKNRALHGSTVFRVQFEQNFTRDAAQFQEWSGQYEAFMTSLQARIKAQQQFQRNQQQNAAAAAFLRQQNGGEAVQENEEQQAPPAPVSQDEINHAQQLRQYEQQRSAELRSRQALIQSRGLGKYSEYFALFGKCFNFTVHEKILKGGSANPEQYNAYFKVCPFISILQRTETPEVLDSLSRLAASAPELQKLQLEEKDATAALKAAGGEGAVVEDEGFQDCSDAVDATTGLPVAPRCLRRHNIRHLQAVVQKDQETSKFTVVGQWAGFLPDAFDNITALDVLERFRYGIAPEVAGAVPNETPFLVHQYTHGEPCWNGPTRSAAFVFECDSVDRVLKIVENGMCRYEVLFGSPSACNDDVAKLVTSRVEAAARSQRG